MFHQGFSYYKQPRQWAPIVNQQGQQYFENPNQINNQPDHQYNSNANSVLTSVNFSHHLTQNNQLHQFQEQVNCHSPPLPPPPPPPPGGNKISLNSNNHLNNNPLGHSSLTTPSTPSNPNVSSLAARSPNSSDHLPPAFLSSNLNQHQHQQQQQRLQVNKSQSRHLFGQLDSAPYPQIRQSITAKRQLDHTSDYNIDHNATDQSSDQSFGFQNVAIREGDDQTVQYMDSSNHGYRANGRGSFTSSHLASARVDSVMAARKSLLVKRPSNQFLSQLYFLFHFALGICLIQASGKQ